MDDDGNGFIFMTYRVVWSSETLSSRNAKALLFLPRSPRSRANVCGAWLTVMRRPREIRADGHAHIWPEGLMNSAKPFDLMCLTPLICARVTDFCGSFKHTWQSSECKGSGLFQAYSNSFMLSHNSEVNVKWKVSLFHLSS